MDAATAADIVDNIIHSIEHQPDLAEAWDGIDPFTLKEIKLAWQKIIINLANANGPNPTQTS